MSIYLRFFYKRNSSQKEKGEEFIQSSSISFLVKTTPPPSFFRFFTRDLFSKRGFLITFNLNYYLDQESLSEIICKNTLSSGENSYGLK